MNIFWTCRASPKSPLAATTVAGNRRAISSAWLGPLERDHRTAAQGLGNNLAGALEGFVFQPLDHTDDRPICLEVPTDFIQRAAEKLRGNRRDQEFSAVQSLLQICRHLNFVRQFDTGQETLVLPHGLNLLRVGRITRPNRYFLIVMLSQQNRTGCCHRSAAENRNFCTHGSSSSPGSRK
ncbi:MAG: hypothetical protein V9F02_09290 [Chitinophagaceae bacterium]